MNSPRWDETWHRLLQWTNGQAPSERLAMQIVAADGYSEINPAHPLGGKDQGHDAWCVRLGDPWLVAVYFPRGQQHFTAILTKFRSDAASATRRGADRLLFVTNQELRLAERSALSVEWHGVLEIYHLERIAVILDTPAMAPIRKQYLGFDFDSRPKGGDGGDAAAYDGGTAYGGDGGETGTLGDGGQGGDATASGEGSWARGGPGGRGGVGAAGPGGDAHVRGGGIGMGGEGGEAERPDGRSGRGGRSGGDLLGIPTPPLPDGRQPGEGGRSANRAPYEGKLTTIKALLQRYYSYPQDSIDRDHNAVLPLAWLNRQLEESGVAWRVGIDEGEFAFTEVLQDLPATRKYNALDIEPPVGITSSPRESQVVQGIALVVCDEMKWKVPADTQLSWSRDIIGTRDTIACRTFPSRFGPLAVYVIIAGAGVVPLSVRLHAPNNEIVVAQDGVASNWGELSTCEFAFHIDEFELVHPGIYHWVVQTGERAILSRPMSVRRISA